MNGSKAFTADIISGVVQKITDQTASYDILICPPAPYLAQANEQASSYQVDIAIGAQNVSPHESGAYTGEVSLPMLSDLGCRYVLLGHSERREYYGETDQVVADKFEACVNAGMSVVPVLCVGESLSERESGDTEAVVARQINSVLDKVGIESFKGAVIAYEPVWAIGTGKTASPEQAQQVHAYIRGLLADKNAEIAERIQLLYGGSVKPANAEELFSQNDIDGGLIGGASLDAESFAGICKAAQKLA